MYIQLSNGDLIKKSAVKYLISGCVGIECGSSSVSFKLPTKDDVKAVREVLLDNNESN